MCHVLNIGAESVSVPSWKCLRLSPPDNSDIAGDLRLDSLIHLLYEAETSPPSLYINQKTFHAAEITLAILLHPKRSG